MILCARQNVEPRANFRPVIWVFATYVVIPREAISHSTFFNSVECPSLVKLLFRYQDQIFSNNLYVTSAPGGLSATWKTQTFFVVHQCTKPFSLALKCSLPSGCSQLQVQFWTPEKNKV